MFLSSTICLFFCFQFFDGLFCVEQRECNEGNKGSLASLVSTTDSSDSRLEKTRVDSLLLSLVQWEGSDGIRRLVGNGLFWKVAIGLEGVGRNVEHVRMQIADLELVVANVAAVEVLQIAQFEQHPSRVSLQKVVQVVVAFVQILTPSQHYFHHY